MLVELRHLRALQAVLATGSFTAAAAARHISQPALWAQVKELEVELGLKLFLRSGRGVVPTAACEALRPRLGAALHEIAELRRLATEVREGREAPARIGCASSHVAHFLAGCIGELADADPRTPFPVIVPVTSATSVETLARGGVDLLVEPRRRRPGRRAARLYDMETVAVGPLVKGRALDLRALAGAPIATLPADSLLRGALDDAAAAAGVALRVVYESRDASALLALARDGPCTAVMHQEMLDAGARRARLRVGRRGLAIPVWLSWRPDDALSPAARALRDVMLRRASR